MSSLSLLKKNFLLVYEEPMHVRTSEVSNFIRRRLRRLRKKRMRFFVLLG
jgi:hypothetical protein